MSVRAAYSQLKSDRLQALYQWMFIRSSSWSSKVVRSKFIKYYEDQGHLNYPSSSVIPKKGDGTYFTNAGMNQFKPLFLGQCDPSSKLWDLKRAANSQKCIRVGGKHNDLEDVGQDFTHHTFFEMLGSWSFGDYFKREACQMAHDFLTQHLLIPEDRLYFTYFGGDQSMGLAADEECLDIWASLGIPRTRILPFGDNFWDMGATGPCGPCTEIHYDHTGGGGHAASEVNSDSPNVVEIWNLVFMQYNRHIDQTLSPLPSQHVDTGMGFERMVAIKNGVSDNYKTDLFMPLFDIIQQTTKCSPYQGKLSQDDTAYRILADHSRMLTVAISDGLLPSRDNLGYKVRVILHKCIHLCRRHFQADPYILVPALVKGVVTSLGEAFPELVQNQGRVIDVISSAIGHYDRTMEQATDSFNKMMSKVKPVNVLSGGVISALEKGQFGNTMSLETIVDVAEKRGMKLNMKEYQQYVQESSKNVQSPQRPLVSTQSPLNELVDLLIEQGKPVTNDAFKYSFSTPSGTCDFSSMAAKTSPCSIQGMLGHDQEEVTQHQLREGQKGEIILDKTCFYAEAGGQEPDRGFLHSQTGTFVVEDVQNRRGYVVHSGHVTQGHIALDQNVSPEISFTYREGNMRNHTGTHLVNTALLDVLPTSKQEGSNISPHRFTFDFLALSKLEDVGVIETKVKDIIRGAHSVTCAEMTLAEAKDNQRIGWNKNEEYPDRVRVVSIGSPSAPESGLVSMELCGGTHVLNTADIGDFCITGLHNKSQHVQRVVCVTGPQAIQANNNGEIVGSMCNLLQQLHTFSRGKTDSGTVIDATQALVSRAEQVKEYLLKTLADCPDASDSIKKDTEKIVAILESLHSELQPLQAVSLVNKDCVGVMKHLLHCLHQCQHLELLPKRSRHTIHACVQNLQHKVQALINAGKADTLRQVLLKMDAEGDDSQPMFSTVDADMDPRQVVKVVTKYASPRPLILLQESKPAWNLTLSIPCSPGKPKPEEDVANLLSVLREVGSAKGKLASKSKGGDRFVVKGSVAGCHDAGDIESCVRRWWGGR